ncbi:MAG: ABC transporter permease [Lachnospiraceae bacterium]|nr:ABC transporter permease [Lachnospiraceae bacterium]
MNTIKEIWHYREMIAGLVRRDLRGRYKASFLGFLWTFINPLLQLLVYTMVFSIILRSNIEQYYIHLFVALVPWIFFSSSMTGGAQCILTMKDMVKKIYFPREVLPISSSIAAFINMLFSFIVIFIVLIISGRGINPVACLYLPLIMIVELVLNMGMTLVTSGLTVYFRDLQHILGILSQAWMYLTPVVYNIAVVPKRLLPLFYLNPMTPIIQAYRDILYYKQIPHTTVLVRSLAFGIAAIVIGELIFRHLQKGFAEEL